jgi:hypothetical protein
MALNVGLHVSFDNMQDWKVIWEKVGEVNITKEGGVNRFFRNVGTSLPNYTPQKHNLNLSAILITKSLS